MDIDKNDKIKKKENSYRTRTRGGWKESQKHPKKDYPQALILSTSCFLFRERGMVGIFFVESRDFIFIKLQVIFDGEYHHSSKYFTYFSVDLTYING